MGQTTYNSIEDYLAALDPVKHATIAAVLDVIQKRFPELSARIAWNVPTLHRNGKYVVGLCAYQRHLTFSVFSPHIIRDFAPRLAGYVQFKNCFHLPVDWRIDEALITDMVSARLTELD